MKRLQWTNILGGMSLVLGILLSSGVYAQDIQLQGQPTRDQLFLALEEAINLALQNNMEIQIQRYNPEIKKEDIKNAEAAFGTSLSATGAQTLSENPTGQTSAKTVTSLSTGVERRFSSGGYYQVNLTTSMLTFDDMETTVTDPQTGLPVSRTISVDNQYSTGVELTVGHALLKGKGTDVNTTPILIASKNKELADSELRAKIIDVVSQIKKIYWQLVFVRGDLQAKQLSLQWAYDLVKINEAQVKVGTLAPIEVLAAQATAADREVKIISAEKTVRDVEDALKRLLNVSEFDPIWNAELIPTSEPVAAKQPVDLDDSIRRALENREELTQLKKGIEIQELGIRVSENQLLPEWSLQGTVSLDGRDTDIGGSLGNFVGFDSYDLSVSTRFSYPLGNTAAKSSLNKARLEWDKNKLALHNLEQLLTLEIRQAVRAVEISYQLVEATRVAKNLAEQRLEAEQKKFNEGLSTNFQVLSYQESLSSTRSLETQAITSYNQSLVELEQATGMTLQQHNIVVE